jgi:hypothetical protein
MSEVGYATPEAAACGDIPSRYVEVIATTVSPDHRAAVVLLATNEPPVVETYVQACIRTAGTWRPGPVAWNASRSGIGSAFVRFEEDEARILRALVADGPAPPGAREAIVEFAGEQHVVRVFHDHFLFVLWDVRSMSDRPQVKAFRGPRGQTVPAEWR